MAEVVLDANVIVALLYATDSQHQRAVELADRLEAEGHNLVLVDFLIFEALSVLCRRAAQRKTAPPDLVAAVAVMRNWFNNGEVRFLAHECERLATSVLDIVTALREVQRQYLRSPRRAPRFHGRLPCARGCSHRTAQSPWGRRRAALTHR